MKISWTLTLGSASLVAVVACAGARAIVPLELKSETTVVAVSEKKKPTADKQETSVEESKPVTEQPKAAETAPAPTNTQVQPKTSPYSATRPVTPDDLPFQVQVIMAPYVYGSVDFLGMGQGTILWQLEYEDSASGGVVVLTSGSTTMGMGKASMPNPMINFAYKPGAFRIRVISPNSLTSSWVQPNNADPGM